MCYCGIMLAYRAGWCGSCAGQRIGGDLAAAQMGLLSAQGTDAAAIAKVAFTSEDRVGLRMPRASRAVQ